MGRGGDHGALRDVEPSVEFAASGIAGAKASATDFYWAETDEPHASRRKIILAKYPEIRELFGPDSAAFPQIVAIVLLQTWVATLMQDVSWPVVVTVAYFFGAFLNHNLFLAIHELSHNLAFSTIIYNRLLGIFANLPISIPMSVTFQKYHLEHHKYQGVQGMDMDIPSYTEGHLVTNALSKTAWVLSQLFFYAFRPLFLNPKKPGFWEVSNLLCQLTFDAWMLYYAGVKAIAYLLFATFLGGGMHPIAGHFIAEHYIFLKGQETYSYYGPLNLLTWNVGYHVEHHDFPRIPGCKLHRLRQIAPEFYENLGHHASWSYVIYKFITDATVGPFSRVMRKAESRTNKTRHGKTN